MSPRPHRLRKVSNPPLISGFKPYGVNVMADRADIIFLHLEEFEAIRLCDFEMLNHDQAARLMDVSRPTLTRIYARARQKMAEAMVLGRQIIIEGGKIYFDSEWYSCAMCGCYFNLPDKQSANSGCPLCGNTDIEGIQQNSGSQSETIMGCLDICYCPVCGVEKRHKAGFPCREEVCPDCGVEMIRK